MYLHNFSEGFCLFNVRQTKNDFPQMPEEIMVVGIRGCVELVLTSTFSFRIRLCQAGGAPS